MSDRLRAAAEASVIMLRKYGDVPSVVEQVVNELRAALAEPVKQREPLTGEAIYAIALKVLPAVLGMSYIPKEVISFARAVEQAHGIGGSDE